MHIKSVLRFLALIQILVGFCMLVPFALAFYYEEDAAIEAFGITECCIAVFALITLLATRRETITIKARDSYLLVTLVWIVATAFGALPLYLTETFETYPSCYFEIMSGFTTTGATALSSIEDKLRSLCSEGKEERHVSEVV